MKRSKKHQDLVDDYDKAKQKHLKKIASKMLAKDEKWQKFKAKNIDPDYLDLF
jgi:hypothetical protein